MARGKQTPPDVRMAIETYSLRYPDTSSGAIISSLEADPRFTGRVPQARTVQNIVGGLRRAADPSDVWSLPTVPIEQASDARLVLETLGVVHKTSEGRVRFVTKAEADMVVRLRRAHPGI